MSALVNAVPCALCRIGWTGCGLCRLCTVVLDFVCMCWGDEAKVRRTLIFPQSVETVWKQHSRTVCEQ